MDFLKLIAAIFWNFQQHRLRALWRLTFQFILMVILLVVTSLISWILRLGIPQDWLKYIDPTGNFLDLVSQVPAILISVGLAVWLFDRRSVADFGFHISPAWWHNFAFGLALGGLLMSLIFLVELVAGWLSITGLFIPVGKAPFILGWLCQFVLFVCVGVYEEVLSRGYQLRNLAEGLNFRWLGPRAALILACLISSTIFGLEHLSNPNASITSAVLDGAAGIFLSLGYLLTGELAIPIGLHIAWNFFQGNVFGFPVSGINAGASVITITQHGPDWVTGGAFGPEAGMIGLTTIIIGCLLIIAWVGRQGQRTRLAAHLAIYGSRMEKK